MKERIQKESNYLCTQESSLILCVHETLQMASTAIPTAALGLVG
jgi:hypothetical protein